MEAKKKRVGKIVLAPGMNVWEHEWRTAEAFACAGYVVEFVRHSEQDFHTSPDLVLCGMEWEIKAPTSSNKKALRRNIHKALKQAPNIIIDVRRMKKIPVHEVERELRRLAPTFSNLRNLVYVDRLGRIIDIKGDAVKQ